MTNEKQIEANKTNAQLSTGPNDTSKTKYNAVKYGLTSGCNFTKEEEETIQTIYDDLSQVLIPKNRLQEFVLGRICLYVWRLQKSSHLEQKQLRNSLIDEKNSNKLDNKYKDIFVEGEPRILGESINTNIDLLMRYEVTNENRLIKMVKFFHSLNNS